MASRLADLVRRVSRCKEFSVLLLLVSEIEIVGLYYILNSGEIRFVTSVNSQFKVLQSDYHQKPDITLF